MKFIIKASTLAAALALSACGGGGSSLATVSGTAATGAALAGATVSMKCASGASFSATTDFGGHYSVDVGGAATLPCLVEVSYKDAGGATQTLHSIATVLGTANITPVTELLLASLAGGSAANAFNAFDAAKTTGYTGAQIRAAATAVKTYLHDTLGVDTSKLPDDPLGASLNAAVGATAGDDFDKVLDDLAAKLKTGGKKLSDAVADIGKVGSGGGVGGTTLGSLTVTGIGNTARTGTFAPVTFKQASGTDTDVNGQTADGKFELDVVFTSTGTIKSAAIWYFEANGVTTFFGCNNTNLPCGNLVGYEPLMKQILFNNVVLSQVENVFPGPMTLATGTDQIRVSGTLSAQ